MNPIFAVEADVMQDIVNFMKQLVVRPHLHPFHRHQQREPEFERSNEGKKCAV